MIINLTTGETFDDMSGYLTSQAPESPYWDTKYPTSTLNFVAMGTYLQTQEALDFLTGKLLELSATSEPVITYQPISNRIDTVTYTEDTAYGYRVSYITTYLYKLPDAENLRTIAVQGKSYSVESQPLNI